MVSGVVVDDVPVGLKDVMSMVAVAVDVAHPSLWLGIHASNETTNKWDLTPKRLAFRMIV